MLGIIVSISIYIIGIITYITNYGKSIIMLLIGLELALLGISLTFLIIGYYLSDLLGAVVSLYILVLAGAESAIALSYLVCFYPIRNSLTLN